MHSIVRLSSVSWGNNVYPRSRHLCPKDKNVEKTSGECKNLYSDQKSGICWFARALGGNLKAN